jgi:hypothetical protein
MIVIINRETTICSACEQTVTIDHSQIACREYIRLGYGPTTVGVVGGRPSRWSRLLSQSDELRAQGRELRRA